MPGKYALQSVRVAWSRGRDSCKGLHKNKWASCHSHLLTVLAFRKHMKPFTIRKAVQPSRGQPARESS